MLNQQKILTALNAMQNDNIPLYCNSVQLFINKSTRSFNRVYNS